MAFSSEPSPTDLELWDRVENEPPGTFKILTAVGAGVEAYIQQHLKNYAELQSRITHGANAGCFIEVISIRLQVIDFWLRIYFANQRATNYDRRREFGALVSQCHALGLSDDVTSRLLAFNRTRIDAIHGYVVGTTDYQKLEQAAAVADSLLRDVVVFVVSNSGTVVTDRAQLFAAPGAMVVHVEGFCRDVRSGVRY